MEASFRRFVTLSLTLACSAVASMSFAQGNDTHVTTAEQYWQGTQAGARAGVWLDQGPLSVGDNRRDLVIGSPGGPLILGHVYIINGGPDREGALSLANADAVITGASNGDLFGTSTAVGNILSLEPDAPFSRNLVVGAPGAGGLNRGRVYLFVGGFGSFANVVASDAVFVVTGAPGDLLGSMLATADLDNDGYREIVIGAPGNQRIYVIKGGPSLSGSQDLTVTAAARTYTLPGIGGVMTAGDVTGDNMQDLVVGSPATNVVYLFNGRSGTMATTPDAVFGGLEAGDLTGAALRLADMDADGHRDILVGAPGGDGADNTRTNAGEVYLIYGGIPLTSRNFLAADVTFFGRAGERLGAALSAGDINRDIPNDAVMLAENAAGGAGILYLYYGRARHNVGAVLPDGRRAVDFEVAGQVSRRIGSDTTVGAITAAQVFEVTGEGARDIVAGIPTRDSNAGTVYFTLSPKLTLSQNSLTMVVKRGNAATSSILVKNETGIPITWEASSNRDWLTFTPAGGGAVNHTAGTLSITASSASLGPGTHTGTVTVRSTSPDLTLFRPLAVTLYVTQTMMSLDGPADGSTVSQPFNIGGWAIDLGATADSGIDVVHVWAFPTNGSSPVFLGAQPANGPRPDVGAAFGANFTNSGWNVQVTGLAPGTYHVAAYAYNKRLQAFDDARVATVTVQASTYMSVDTPANNSTVGTSFYIAGWAIDAASSSGTGVDAIHVWAFPAGGGDAKFLGVGNYGLARGDVGAAFGSRFTNSGFNLVVTAAAGLTPGNYTVVIYARSTVTGTFSQARGLSLRVQ